MQTATGREMGGSRARLGEGAQRRGRIAWDSRSVSAEGTTSQTASRSFGADGAVFLGDRRGRCYCSREELNSRRAWVVNRVIGSSVEMWLRDDGDVVTSCDISRIQLDRGRYSLGPVRYRGAVTRNVLLVV